MLSLSLLIMRLIVGTIFFVHGAQKLFGAFDGQGMAPLIAGQGTVLAYLVAIGECFGGIGIALGFLTRFSAAANIVIMAGAIALVHGKNGLLLQNGGCEYNLALIGLLVPLVLLGPGAFSLGRFFLPKSATSGRPLVVIE